MPISKGKIFIAAGFIAWASTATAGLSSSCESSNERERAVAEWRDGAAAAGVPQEAMRSADGLIELAPPYDRRTPPDFWLDPLYDLAEEKIGLPTAEGETRWVHTASKKEIWFALLHPGRTTVVPCSEGAVERNIRIRQTTIAWAERTSWEWPEGGAARWAGEFWNKGTPTKDVADAMMDVFKRQDQYSFGCYTAAKIIASQGVLDVFARTHPDEKRLKAVKDSLWSDGDPLIGVEPGGMWFFERDYEPGPTPKEGKILRLEENVAAEMFIPGDWVYMLNTDPVSYEKTGYEGSNAFYLGRGLFSDYYADNNHAYPYWRKLDEVFQWRNGVFSRSRDAQKITPLGMKRLREMGESPEKGGLVLPYRATPRWW